MPKLILHAGTHKTGTTAIQTFAVSNRDALMSRGVFYPNYRPHRVPLKDGHHQFAHSVAEAPTARMSLTDVRKMVQRWNAIASETGADVLVSVEAIYRHQIGGGTTSERRLAFLHRIADVLADFDVEPILVFRRPDNFVRSLYQEHIVSPTPRPSLPSLNDWARNPALFQIQYFESACLFRSVFQNLRVLVYEDLIQGSGLYANFFSQIGVSIEGLSSPGEIRTSVSAPQTIVRNYAGNHLLDRASNRAFMKWLQSSHIEALLDRAFGGQRFDLWGSHQERQDFLLSRSEDIESLRKTYFPERETLFPPLRAEDTLLPAPSIPLEVKHVVDEYLRTKSSS